MAIHKLCFKYIISGLLLLSQMGAVKADTSPPYPDSSELLRARIRQSRPDAGRLSLMLELNAFYLRKAMKKPAYLQLFFPLFRQTVRLRDSLNIDVSARLIRLLGIAEETALLHAGAGETALAEKQLKQCIVFHQQLHDNRLHYVFDLLAQNEKQAGNLPAALYYNLEAVKSMEASGDRSQADRFYYGPGCTLAELKQYDKALPYLKKAFGVLQRKNYPEAYHFVLLTLSISQRRVEGPEKALSNLKKAIAASPPVSLKQRSNDCLALAGCYKAMRRYREAELQYLELVRITEQVKKTGRYNQEDYATAYTFITDFYLLTKNYPQVGKYVKILLHIPTSDFVPLQLGQIHQTAFKADSAAGNYLSAIRHFELFKRLNDSMYNATKSRQVAELQIKYETAQKNKDLQLQAKDIQLLKKQTQLQRSLVSQTRTNRNWSFAGMILLFGIGYYRYLLKQNTNRHLQSKQKEITDKNQELETLLHENEWLLKEVHHRVKNNLQIVMSLLNSQSSYLKDEAALNAVMESQHRVQAMSLIHQKLYRSNCATAIYMPDYIRELVDYLKDCFSIRQAVLFDLQIERLHLDVSRAVPVGLILNEVITNSLKYAFPYSANDRLSIRMFRSPAGVIRLDITDNGRGFADDLIPEKQQSFGLILMKGLAEDLDGQFTISSNKGTNVSLVFSDIYSHHPKNRQPS